MKTSDKGVAAIMRHEGVVPGPYFDSVGVQTYGVGHTAAAGFPNPAEMPAGMPEDLDTELGRVFDVFETDLIKYEADVDRAIKVPVSQHEFDAAVSFHYNTGAIGTATWVKTLNGGDRAKAAEQIMNWTKPEEIIPRRQAEQRLFRDGIYPSEPIVVWQVNTSRHVIWTPAKTLSQDEALRLMGGGDEVNHPLPEEQPPERGPSALIGLGAIIGGAVAAVLSWAITLFNGG